MGVIHRGASCSEWVLSRGTAAVFRSPFRGQRRKFPSFVDLPMVLYGPAVLVSILVAFFRFASG
jgi:hypothetical protein